MINTKPYQANRLRPLILCLGIFFAGVIVIAVLGINGFFHTNPYGDELTIANFSKYYPDMPQDTTDSLFASLYKSALINTPDGEKTPTSGAQIRSGSTTNTYNDDTEFHQGEFIVDVPEIRQSFQISFAWTTQENPGVPNNQIAIHCLLGEASAYNASSCKDDYESDAAQQLYTKYPFLDELPIKVSYYTDNYSNYIYYVISYKADTDDMKLTFIITDYSGGNRERAMEKINSFGLKSNEYTVEYNDESQSIRPLPYSE